MANKFEEQIRILELAHGDILDVWADIPIDDKRIDRKMCAITDAMLEIEEILYKLGKED